MENSKPRERERTFQYDDDLPPLPVQPLQQTLHKYLESVKPFLTEEKFVETQKLVKEFESGAGQILQEKLVARSQSSKNWLEAWWDDVYLEIRQPLGVLQNFSGAASHQEKVWPRGEGTQLQRCSIYLWHLLTYYQLMRKELLPVEKNRNGSKIFSMDQYRRIFHCCREPGVSRDSMDCCFKTELEGECPNHIHVISNGHIFKLTPFDDQGKLLTAPEICSQLKFIKEKSQSKGQCIGTLTADDRTTFAKALDHLKSLSPDNSAHVDVIKTSIIGCILEDSRPKDDQETCIMGLAGPSPHNRWFDKSFHLIFTQNGAFSVDVDHAAYDGIVTVMSSYYVFENIMKDNGGWPKNQSENDVRSDIAMPEELTFTTDERVEKYIDHALSTYTKLAANFQVECLTYDTYGQDYLKKYRLHPDTTVQLAIQLTYYTLYNRPGSTYETATTRQFYRGRTETVRSCTVEAMDWCKAMRNSQSETSDKLSLLRKAHDKHNALMAEAANGQGIDRHLLGLYNISKELGAPVPELYTDKAYTLSGGGGNFVLSTSTAGYTPLMGGIAPMRNDGYMCCYRIGKKDFQITTTSFRDCAETDSRRFLDEFARALDQIKDVLPPDNNA